MNDKGFFVIALLGVGGYFLWKKFGGSATAATPQAAVGTGVPSMPSTTIPGGAVEASGAIRDVTGNIGPAIYSVSQGWISPPGHAPVVQSTGSPIPKSVPIVPSPQQKVIAPISTRLPVNNLRYVSSTPYNSILRSKIATSARVA